MFQVLNKVTGGKPRATRRVILKALCYTLIQDSCGLRELQLPEECKQNSDGSSESP